MDDMQKSYAHFLLSLQRRLQQTVATDITLTLSDDNLIDVNCDNVLSEDDAVLLETTIKIMKKIYDDSQDSGRLQHPYRENVNIDELDDDLRHFQDMINRNNLRKEIIQAQLKKEREERQRLEDERYEKRRIEHEEQRKKQLAEEELKFEKANKYVSPWGVIKVEGWYKFSIDFNGKDPDKMIQRCLYRRVHFLINRSYDYYKVIDSKEMRRYKSKKSALISRLIEDFVLNDFFGMYKYVRTGNISSKVRKIFRYDENTLISESYIQNVSCEGPNNNNKTWCKVKFVMGDEITDMSNLSKKGNILNIHPYIMIELYKRYRALETLKKNKIFQKQLEKWRDELWIPNGRMCKRGWEECQKMQHEGV